MQTLLSIYTTSQFLLGSYLLSSPLPAISQLKQANSRNDSPTLLLYLLPHTSFHFRYIKGAGRSTVVHTWFRSNLLAQFSSGSI
ncbi:hypothetical protein F5Y05DRAFT_381730 [Hypoxylon sp. FL0543]|nr:hypothetical protein F5Y05DRAFT_381730 [Hypoxylon sp. FL0543]